MILEERVERRVRIEKFKPTLCESQKGLIERLSRNSTKLKPPLIMRREYEYWIKAFHYW
jgi:hypothetical protein